MEDKDFLIYVRCSLTLTKSLENKEIPLSEPPLRGNQIQTRDNKCPVWGWLPGVPARRNLNRGETADALPSHLRRSSY
jgi:hypothetical protein